MRNMNKRQPRQIGGSSFAFVAQGYPTSIRAKANRYADRGYSYRIFSSGKERLLYIGPKRRIKKVKKKLKKPKKDKKPKQ